MIFYDTHPIKPITQLSFVSWPCISMLDAFSQSFKHFKEDFFKVVVKELGRSYFYNEDGSCQRHLFAVILTST